MEYRGLTRKLILFHSKSNAEYKDKSDTEAPHLFLLLQVSVYC